MADFTVVWITDVQRDFIDYWLESDSQERRRLTDAANLIDQVLASSPEAHGSPLPSEPRLQVWTLPGFVPAISVVFETLPDDRIVRVLSISLAVE